MGKRRKPATGKAASGKVSDPGATLGLWLKETEALGSETLRRLGWTRLGPKDTEQPAVNGKARHRIILPECVFVRDFSPAERVAHEKTEKALTFSAWAMLADAAELRAALPRLKDRQVQDAMLQAFMAGARIGFFDEMLPGIGKYEPYLRRINNLTNSNSAKKNKAAAADKQRWYLMSQSDEDPWPLAGLLSRRHPGLGGQRAFYNSYKKRNP